MKSHRPKPVNPNLQGIDFEVKSQSIKNLLIGVALVLLFSFLLLAASFLFLILLGFSIARFNFSGIKPYLSFVTPRVLRIYRLSQQYLFTPVNIFNDPREPILYLRSFADDKDEDAGRLYRETSEELLIETLKVVGPVITIGNPKETKNSLPYIGATRIYMNENWKAQVEKLMSVSRLVVIEANYTESLIWEMKTAKNIVPPNRLLISFLSKYDSYLSRYEFGGSKFGYRGLEYTHIRFARVFSEIFSDNLPVKDANVCFVYFDDKWQSRSISLEPERTKLGFINLDKITPTSSLNEYYLPFKKIKRAIMLLLQYNEIIFHPVYAREIAAEKIRLEDERLRQEAEKAASQPFFSTEQRESGALRPTQKPAEDVPLFESITNKPISKAIWIRVAISLLPFLIVIGGFVFLIVSPPSVNKYLEEAARSNLTRDFERAIDNCNKAIELYPAFAEGYKCLGNAYSGKNNYGMAIQKYNKALELDPKDADTYYNRANSYFNLKENYDKVVEDATEAIRLNPQNASAYGLRGAAYYFKNTFDLALSDLNKAVELDNEEFFAYFFRGIIHERNENYDVALEDLNAAIKFNFSGDAAYYYERAMIFYKKKDYDLSIDDFGRAIKRNPFDFNFYFCRGTVYCERQTTVSKNNDYFQGIKDLSKAIELNPNFADAYRNRALAYSKINQGKKATVDWKKYKELSELKK